MTTLIERAQAANPQNKVPVNDRDEPGFEGYRDYECRCEACHSFGKSHQADWHDPIIHRAYDTAGIGWAVQVEWWPHQLAWRVYGELQDGDADYGFLSREMTVPFTEALQAANALADRLNEADRPEVPDLATYVASALISTAHLHRKGSDFANALTWLLKHPHLGDVGVDNLIQALDATGCTPGAGRSK